MTRLLPLLLTVILTPLGPALANGPSQRVTGLTATASSEYASGNTPAIAANAVDGDPSTYKRFAERGLSLHEAMAAPRTLLVGEAAGIDPIIGEGIAQAILYGAAAARYLIRKLGQRDFDFADGPAALARTRVGFDLRFRRRTVDFLYGKSRSRVEKCMVESDDFTELGMHYFAGLHIPRAQAFRVGSRKTNGPQAWQGPEVIRRGNRKPTLRVLRPSCTRRDEMDAKGSSAFGRP